MTVGSGECEQLGHGGDAARRDAFTLDAPALLRRHVYIDTMGLNAASVTAAVAMLGADHVLAGTDWPIVVEKAVPERLRAAMVAAGLNAQDQDLIARGNVLRLLGVG